MTMNTIQRLSLTSALLLTLAGCAATIDQGGIEQRTSLAIGRDVGSFTLSERIEETGGRINYTARTQDGAVYKCYLYSATGLQRTMSFGQTPHSDAICTPFGKAGAATTAPAAQKGGGQCNALLKAAGRC
jgi:hypothetical protein